MGQCILLPWPTRCRSRHYCRGCGPSFYRLRIPAAIVALIAAGLATAATFLNSNENKQQNLKLSAAWQELADDVRLTVIKYSRAKDEELSRYDYLIGDVIYFNKRKGALLRGDLASMPERPPLKN